MKHRILWILSAFLILSSASVFAQSATISSGGGNALVTAGDVDGWATHIVFDFADGVNQIDVAHVSGWVDARQSVPLSLAFNRDPCKTYQVDTFWGLAPKAQYTMSDLGNLPLLASGLLPALSNCRLPPDAPPPPPTCTVKTVQYRGFPGYDWLATSAPWYPDVRGPYVLPAVMAAGGLWSQMMITGDDYHVSDPDYTPWQEHEQVRIYYWPSGIVSGPTDDVPSDVLSVKSYMGVINLPPGQTHFYILHAGPINLDAEGKPIPSDSVKPVWATWQSLCPQVGGE